MFSGRCAENQGYGFIGHPFFELSSQFVSGLGNGIQVEAPRLSGGSIPTRGADGDWVDAGGKTTASRHRLERVGASQACLLKGRSSGHDRLEDEPKVEDVAGRPRRLGLACSGLMYWGVPSAASRWQSGLSGEELGRAQSISCSPTGSSVPVFHQAPVHHQSFAVTAEHDIRGL